MNLRKSELVKFIWRVTASHLVAYSLAGLFAVSVMNYGHLYSLPPPCRTS